MCFPYWQGCITLLIFLAFFAGFFAIGIVGFKNGNVLLSVPRLCFTMLLACIFKASSISGKELQSLLYRFTCQIGRAAVAVAEVRKTSSLIYLAVQENLED